MKKNSKKVLSKEIKARIAAKHGISPRTVERIKSGDTDNIPVLEDIVRALEEKKTKKKSLKHRLKQLSK